MLTQEAAEPIDRPSPASGGWLGWVGVGIVGLVARWWLSHSAMGYVNADEAYTGVVAFDVLHGHPRLIFGASNYGGVVESYVLAPLLALFGAHMWVMRVVVVTFYAAAAVAAAWAVRPLFRRGIAWVTGGLMWLPSGAIVLLSVTNYLGYGSGTLAAALALGFLMRCADATQPRWMFVVAGIAAGQAVYAHPLYLVPLAPAVVAVMVLRRGDVRIWMVRLVGGLTVGALPLLIWNVTNGFKTLQNPPPLEVTTYRQRLENVIAQLQPRTFGLRGPAGDWLYPRALGLITSLTLLALIHLGLLLLARRSRAGIVACASGLFGVPLLAAFPSLFWYQDARYAIVLLLPWMIGLTVWVDLLFRRRRAVAVWTAAFVVLFGVCSTGKWMHRYTRTYVGDPNAGSLALVAALDKHGMTGVVGEYWIVYRVAFFSDDRIVAQVVKGSPDRSERSSAQVAALPADKVAWVFSPGHEQVDKMPGNGTGYLREEVAGVTILFPPGR